MGILEEGSPIAEIVSIRTLNLTVNVYLGTSKKEINVEDQDIGEMQEQNVR